MPLLEGLLITAEAGSLTLTGYDLSMGIRTTAEAEVMEPGSIVLNARLFYDIVRKLPQDAVYLETDDKLLTTIKCGRAVFNLIATEADEYPALAEVSAETGFSLPQAMLKSMIAQTIFSVSDNESKPSTRAVYSSSGQPPERRGGGRLPPVRAPRDGRGHSRGHEVRRAGLVPARDRAHPDRGGRQRRDLPGPQEHPCSASAAPR